MRGYQPKEPFNPSDWTHLHDCWLHAKGTKPTSEQLTLLFDQLPTHLQHLADEWGMNDIVFRDGVIEWIEQTHFGD